MAEEQGPTAHRQPATTKIWIGQMIQKLFQLEMHEVLIDGFDTQVYRFLIPR